MMRSTSSRRGNAAEIPLCTHLAAVVLLPSLLLFATAARGLAQDEASETAGATQTAAADARWSDTPAPFEPGEAINGHRLLGLRPDVVSTLLDGVPGGDIAIAALATPLERFGEKTRALLLVEIDGATFLDHNPVDNPRVEVYAYALEGGRVGGYLAEAFAIDVSAVGEVVWQSGIKFYGELELPPGVFDLRVLVRNYHSGSSGLAIVPLTIEPSATTDRARTRPLFPTPELRDAWLPIKGGSISRLGEYPFVLGTRALDPAARPVARVGISSRLHLFGSGLQRLGDHSLEFLDATGTTVAKVDLEEERLTETAERVDAQTMSFLPPDLPAGRYIVRHLAVAADGSSVRSPEAQIVLVSGETREKSLLWTDLRWLLSAETADTSPPPEQPRDTQAELSKKERRGRQVRRFAAAYRDLLAGLGEAGPSTMRTALLEFETGALGQSSPAALARLRSAELQVARDLAERDPETILPLVLLHEDMYPFYLGRRLFSLVFHSRAIVGLLADLYSDKGGEPTMAANIFTSLAGQLQEAGLPAGSSRLFWRALANDPTSTSALLGVAAGLEKYAEYSQAIDYLDQLVAATPGHPEGRLRLAINLQRVGLSTRCRLLLEGLIEGDLSTDVGWVRAVASQELARSYIASGALGSAISLLEGELAGSPDRQGHRLLLAQIYDRQGKSAQALSQLGRIRARPTDYRSERLRYDQWPETALAKARRNLSEAASEALPELLEILGAAGSDLAPDSNRVGP